MKPLELLFALLKQFIRFEPGRLTDLQDQAAKWQNEERTKNGVIARFIVMCDLWYMQVACAILFLFSVKYISSWMMQAEPSVLDEYDEDDDEDDDYDETPLRTNVRKFKIG